MTKTSNTQLVPCVVPLDLAEGLVELTLATCVSDNTRRAYRLRLLNFLGSRHPLSREGVALYVKGMRQKGNGPVTINLFMAAIKKLAKEAEIHNLIPYKTYSQIQDLKSVKHTRGKTGLWLTVAQVEELLGLPDRSTYYGQRDACILAILVGCGLRRDEAIDLEWAQYQSREGRMCLVNVKGKGGKFRTVPVPLWAQADIDVWAITSQTQEPPPTGQLEAAQAAWRRSRPLDLSRICGRVGYTQIHNLVTAYGERLGVDLSPHDLRRTLARMMHRAGAGIEQIQFTLGHQHLQTTTIYLGTMLELAPGQAGVDKIQIRRKA